MDNQREHTDPDQTKMTHHPMQTLRNLRQTRGWTQAELAHRAGVISKERYDGPEISGGTISAYELGHRVPTLKTLRPIADALGTDVAFLLDVKGGMMLSKVELLEIMLEKANQEILDVARKERVSDYIRLIMRELEDESKSAK
jgi:transcriptional regulator with XRE-family HTH domain